jgi:CBS domain containing-hemolysin-like protein
MEAIGLAVFLLLIIIMVNIAFDIVGTAATAATEAPLNAMAARKVTGAQEGLHLVKNADKVANFANDVIGDVAGTVAGALGITLMSRALLAWPGTSELWLNILMTASIASLTVAGKAMGKRVAVTQANQVVFLAGRIIAGYRRTIGSFTGRRGKN